MCKYFLHSVVLLSCLISFFTEQKFWFIWVFFSFIDGAFPVMSKKFKYSRLLRLFPVFFQKFIFFFSSYLWSILSTLFLIKCEVELAFHLFTKRCPISPTSFVEKMVLAPLNSFASCSKFSWLYLCGFSLLICFLSL